MGFEKIPGLPGRVYVPDETSGKKHPCKDCFCCRWCSEQKCSKCLKKEKCCRQNLQDPGKK